MSKVASAESLQSRSAFKLKEFCHIEEVGGAIAKAVDPMGAFSSIINAQMAWLAHPQEYLRASSCLSDDLMELTGHVMRRAMGLKSEDVIVPNADDGRFTDPAWVNDATWDIVKEWYLAFTHRWQDMYYDTPGLSEKARRRAAFWSRKWINMMAPTNFFWLNPVAMRRCVETNGESVVRGLKNLMRDVKAKNILMVDPDAFVVGKDLALTPGKVVMRNELVELLHFEPTTEKVHETPILIVMPWINKFYILDLTPKKSMVKYLTDQGYSVFMTSWKNPTAEMANTRFDDYLEKGVIESVRVVTEFCKVPQINMVGYCIGGSLVATYMAWANRHYAADKMPIKSWTLFTTLTDFSNPGDIEVFLNEDTIESMEEGMKKKGYLEGNQMSSAFRMLRSNGLIWNYWVHSYLLGEDLPPFDVLFWNMDTTRMPYAMHSWYLREMYLQNNLIKRDHLHVAGEPIDLDQITQPLYAVTAEDDHIAPWKACYRIRKFVNVKAPVRFVVSTSGHILGIVNPPTNPPKRAYWVGEPERNESWERWMDRAEKRKGTWWEDWMVWLNERSGPMVPAYPVENKKFPGLGDTPGTYVLEK
ncbi:MAG: alpha/beta fold hydrolase [Proteobacteria bacterium]|nr:alpha/beta fold hydrolase [Pseudomonadota bacterium]